MKFLFNLYFIALLSNFLLSCNRNTAVEEFTQVEKLMVDNPDSALSILESIPSPEKMSKADYAEYCLLLTEARDKAYYTFTSDSVIQVVADYALARGDNHLKARTCYLLGRVCHEMMCYERAQENYLRAIPFAREENNYPLLMRIHNQCGNLYRNRKLYDKALSSLQEALKYCRLANDQANLPYCLRDIGRVYLFTGNIDSTLHYYHQAIDVARMNNAGYAESVIYQELGVAYKTAGKYRDAIEAVRHSSDKNTITDDQSACLSLGSLYLLLNNTDSAACYLNYARNSENPYTSSGANYYLYRLAVQTGHYKEAVYYNELYTAQKDSLDALGSKDELLDLAHRFEQEELKNDLELKYTRTRGNYLVALIIMIMTLSATLILYYRYRFRKERQLLEQQMHLQNEKRLRTQGEELIKRNQLQIETNQQLIEARDGQLVAMRRQFLTQETELLKKENQLLRLAEEKRALSDRFFFKTQYRERIYLVKPSSATDELQKLTAFSINEINDLMEALNSLYDNFTGRLKNEYPLLNEQDIIICSLVKAGAKTIHLAGLICMTPNAVTKRKRKILNRMGITGNEAGLSDFLSRF